MRKIKLLSIVVPCHNEEDVLLPTHQRLNKILQDLNGKRKCADYEIIFIDNGSTDSTLKVLEDIFEKDKHVRIISLRCDFGYQGSISAGLSGAKGDAVVTIDADLQDPPEKIEEMIDHYQSDYDLVLGIREDRKTDTFMKRFFSENYYRLLKFMGAEIVYNHGDFRLMSSGLVESFNKLPERNRFIRGMILKLESRYAKVYYSRESRKAGKTKFTPKAMFSFSLDGITSFSYMPLRLAAICGIFMCFGTLIGIAWVFYVKIGQDVVPGWASTLLPIFAIGGFQLFVLGIMGEYIGKLYTEVKQRPIFLVRKEYQH